MIGPRGGRRVSRRPLRTDAAGRRDECTMTDEPTPRAEPGGPGSDLGRRATLRRQQLGLSREEVAARAGASPDYVRYVEERAADPDIGFLLRLADALETT